ncbi:hypothetical protein V6N13_132855 [Hibiscus sabdariffa]
MTQTSAAEYSEATCVVAGVQESVSKGSSLITRSADSRRKSWPFPAFMLLSEITSISLSVNPISFLAASRNNCLFSSIFAGLASSRSIYRTRNGSYKSQLVINSKWNNSRLRSQLNVFFLTPGLQSRTLSSTDPNGPTRNL